MKKLLIIFLMIFCIFDKGLYAGCPINGSVYFAGKGYDTSDASNLKKWYGDVGVDRNDMQLNRLADGDDPCIGIFNNSGRTCKEGSTVVVEDEAGVTVMAAIETTIGGARFCPTTILGANKDECEIVWTDYYVDDADPSKCVWLCRDGFTGPTCELPSTTYGTCDVGLLKKEIYSKYGPISTLKKDIVQEKYSSIAMFHSGFVDQTSGGTMHYQHDTIFIVVGWLDDGHGAWLRPYGVRTWADNWPNMTSAAIIYPATTSYGSVSDVERVLGCKNGYKPNSSTNPTKCIPISETACGGSGGGTGGNAGGSCPNLNWCPGWKAQNGINFYTKYPQNGGPERFCDVTKYKIVDDTDSDGTTCKRIDCANGMNLMWEDNYTCTRCVESAQRGLCTKDSKCKWCSVGKCFNRDTCNCDECSAVVTDQDMLYGPTQSDKCWAILDNDEFKACVTGDTSGED